MLSNNVTRCVGEKCEQRDRCEPVCIICMGNEIAALRARVVELEAAVKIALTNLEGDTAYPETQRVMREALSSD